MKQGIQKIRYGIIADDLTGATDTAAAFASCGFSVAVALDPRRLRSLTAQVIVLSTHSRNEMPTKARRKVNRACAQLRDGGLSFVYKKLDSTGQGNIVAEVEAARDAGEFAAALVCPANPVQGRTMRGGVLRVRDGDSVNLLERFRVQGLTEFSSISSPISALKLTQATEQNRRFIVADATSERDLACLVRAVLQSKQRILLVGSAGMAGELAKLLMGSKSARSNPDGKMPPSRAGRVARCKTLVIAGSNNPVTERQLEKLIGKTHAASLTLNRHTRRDATASLASERHTIIRVPMHHQPDHAILRLLSALTPLFLAGHVDSLLLVGGDTALLVCRFLRPLAIAISGEIVPGLAWGRFIGGLADGLAVCTKPGGFGSDQSLVRAVNFLARVTAAVSLGETCARPPCGFGTSRNHPGGWRSAATNHTNPTE